MKRACILWACCLLVGCTTAEQQINKSAELNSSYVGRPLSDFMIRNGTTPDEFFDLGGQRVFIFSVPCKSWWYTKPLGKGGTPEHFIIERMEIRGYCP